MYASDAPVIAFFLAGSCASPASAGRVRAVAAVPRDVPTGPKNNVIPGSELDLGRASVGARRRPAPSLFGDGTYFDSIGSYTRGHVGGIRHRTKASDEPWGRCPQRHVF